MALLTSEIARIKAELGFALQSTGAIPYIDLNLIFEQIIQPYTTGGAITSSSTSVSNPTGIPVAITLASATGFTTGDRIILDVDARQESATIQSLSGAIATVQLSNVHSGTYPVTVEGPETLIREILTSLRIAGKKLDQQNGSGTLTRVDEIEWAPTKGGKTGFAAIVEQIDYFRAQLAAALGVPLPASRGGSNRRAIY